MTSNDQVFGLREFGRLFDVLSEEVSAEVADILRTRDLRYHVAVESERDDIILAILRRLDSNALWVSGNDKQGVWENGWSENLAEYDRTGDESALIPKFLHQKKVLRLFRNYVVADDADFEFNVIDAARVHFVRKHFSDCQSVHEFGCGSGQHLPTLCRLLPHSAIHGLDWAQSSIEIIERMRAHGLHANLKGQLFNLFEPDRGYTLGRGAGVLTVGTMEQLGTNFEPFLDYLLEQRPQIVMHFETLVELYDESNLVDYLAIRFDEKRNYLRGYVRKLSELASEGRIRIIREHRVQFGSMNHDSYSMLVWSPL